MIGWFGKQNTHSQTWQTPIRWSDTGSCLSTTVINPPFLNHHLFFSPDLSVVPTTSGSIHPQTVRSSSSSSSHHASTSELNDAPGPSTSCPGSITESMHTQRPSGSSRTATEGKKGQDRTGHVETSCYRPFNFDSFLLMQLWSKITSFQLLILLKMVYIV